MINWALKIIGVDQQGFIVITIWIILILIIVIVNELENKSNI